MAQRVCRTELWPVNSYQENWQSRYTDLARLQPVGTEAARAAALARARALPRFLDTEIANLRRGVAEGFTAPKVVVRSVVAQLVRAIKEDVHPASRRYRLYLEGEYLPAARESLGVSSLPGGAACYAAAVRAFATVARSADEVYALGLREMERIEAAMKVISERDFGTSDPWALVARLGSEPEYTFRTGDEIIRMAQAAIDRAKAAMPRAFGRLPKAGFYSSPVARMGMLQRRLSRRASRDRRRHPHEGLDARAGRRVSQDAHDEVPRRRGGRAGSVHLLARTDQLPT